MSTLLAMFGRVAVACWRALAAIWHFIDDVLTVARPCRFSILVIAAGGFVILATDQGKEIVLGLLDHPGRFAPWLWFHVGVFFWALQSWLWARTLLNSGTYGLSRAAPTGRLRWLIDHVPRSLGALAYILAFAALLRAPGRSLGEVIGANAVNIGLTVLFGLLFYWGLVRRRDAPRLIGAGLTLVARNVSLLRSGATSIAARIAAPRPVPATALQRLRAAMPLPLWFNLATGIAILGVSLCAILWPVQVGDAVGLPSIAFIAFGMIVPVGSLLVYAGNTAGFPVVTTLFIAAYAFSYVNDNHAIRTLPSTPARPAFDDAVADWAKACLPPASAGPVPVVFVATAGGGLRAALWTATVLGTLQDRIPSFHKRLFGISGVSGGSLGAAVYSTLLRQDDVDCTKPAAPADYRRRAPAMLDHDFLSPTVTAMLFGDLLQRFLPVPVIPDRAEALERAFEAPWPRGRDAAAPCGAGGMRNAFDCLWRGRDGRTVVERPALLLNGTVEDNGKRIITSNLVIDGRRFADSYDLLSTIGREIRISTAVLNSARFPYVTPAGTLRRAGDDKLFGHVVDGGYFENNGAETVAELIDGVVAVLRARGREIRPIVIQITSDPDLAGKDGSGTNLTRCGHQPANPLPPDNPRRGANETLAPVDAALATRGARGELATAQLRNRFCDGPPPRFFHLAMCAPAGKPAPALGWLMSAESRRRITTQMLTDCGNAAQIAGIEALLQR